jgi:hypothetical protein
MSGNPDAVRYVLNRKIIELEVSNLKLLIQLTKIKGRLNDLVKNLIEKGIELPNLHLISIISEVNDILDLCPSSDPDTP